MCVIVKTKVTHCQDHVLKDNVFLYGLEHHIVKISGNIPDAGETHNKSATLSMDIRD